MKKKARAETIFWLVFTIVLLAAVAYTHVANAEGAVDVAWSAQYAPDTYLYDVEATCDEVTYRYGERWAEDVEMPRDWRYYWTVRSNVQTMYYHKCVAEVLYERFLEETPN
jgi:hypothetical protein